MTDAPWHGDLSAEERAEAIVKSQPDEPPPSREEVMCENAHLQDWNLWLFLLAIIGGVGWIVALLRGC